MTKGEKVNTEETTFINDEKYGIKECDLVQAFFSGSFFLEARSSLVAGCQTSILGVHPTLSDLGREVCL